MPKRQLKLLLIIDNCYHVDIDGGKYPQYCANMQTMEIGIGLKIFQEIEVIEQKH
jgi:hypothetical protein